MGLGQEVRWQILQVPLSADAQKIIFLSQHRYFDTALRFWAFFSSDVLKTSAFTFTIKLMVLGGN